MDQIPLHQIPARAAIFLRPGRRHPALLVQNAVPNNVVFVIQKDAGAKTLGIAKIICEVVI